MTNKLISIVFIGLILLMSIFIASASTVSSTVNDCSSCNSIIDCVKCFNASVILNQANTQVVLNQAENNQVKTDFVSIVENRVHELINSQRQKNGLSALEYNDSLANAARLHSQDMAKNNYFSHDSLDGASVSFRITREGLVCSAFAENIAKTPKLDELDVALSVVHNWMNSAGHKENILGNYSSEGIGVAVSESGEVFVTQDFCYS